MKKVTFLLCLAVLASMNIFAQEVKISEVKLQCENNIMDEYGNHSAWIEVSNFTHKTQKMASVFITNDKSNPTKFRVATGDIRTNIAPKQSVVFFADGQPELGIFHLNFVIAPGETISIYAADGIKLIDEIVIPNDLSIYHSWALNGNGQFELRDGFSVDTAITPGEANVRNTTNDKVNSFQQYDSHGFILTIIAMCIVFSALILLSICFFIFGRINNRLARSKKAKSQSATSEEKISYKEVESDSSEVIAAIGMALYQHVNAHDVEDTVLTINKVKRAYSPWSSKIYTLRELPRR